MLYANIMQSVTSLRNRKPELAANEPALPVTAHIAPDWTLDQFQFFHISLFLFGSYKIFFLFVCDSQVCVFIFEQCISDMVRTRCVTSRREREGSYSAIRISINLDLSFSDRLLKRQLQLQLQAQQEETQPSAYV